MVIRKTIFENSFVIEGGEFASIDLINDSSVNHCIICTFLNYNVLIKEIDIKNVSISSIIHENGSITMMNCEPKNITFNQLQNRGRLTFQNIKAQNDSSLHIIRSDLWEATFYNTNFDFFNEI